MASKRLSGRQRREAARRTRELTKRLRIGAAVAIEGVGEISEQLDSKSAQQHDERPDARTRHCPHGNGEDDGADRRGGSAALDQAHTGGWRS